jgi:hypothetical protein
VSVDRSDLADLAAFLVVSEERSFTAPRPSWTFPNPRSAT